MEDISEKQNVSKVYCAKCNDVFNSREKYEKHLLSHSSGVVCEVCPLDSVVQKIINLFKKSN